SYLFGILDMPFHTYFQHAHKPLYASSDFLNYWYLGVFVALNIYFAKAIEISIGSAVQRIFRWIADGTFTLYLFHYPIILFIACVIEFYPDSYTTSIIVNLVVIISLMFVGNYLETKRPFYKNIFENISTFITSLSVNGKK
ncbi:MAG TPA: hypothetical protein VK796_12555, partial [Cytophaga sp.]|nr:hypothetical protein [Cytophaga sp.]